MGENYHVEKFSDAISFFIDTVPQSYARLKSLCA